MTARRAPEKRCGDCNVCCRLFEIEPLAKPQGLLCRHSGETGCAIWGRHPATCKAFRCLWLDHPQLDERWRPDTAGFVLRAAPGAGALWIDVDPTAPADCWRRAPYYGELKYWSRALRRGEGMVLVCLPEGGAWVITPEEDIFLPDARQDALVEAGYVETSDGPRPFARLVEEPVGRRAAPARA
jgi:hypothetical protein